MKTITLQQTGEATDMIVELQYLQQAYTSISQQIAGITEKLKKDPFNPTMNDSRDRMKETLSELQGIMVDMAKIINNNIRERYDVDLKWLAK